MKEPDYVPDSKGISYPNDFGGCVYHYTGLCACGTDGPAELLVEVMKFCALEPDQKRAHPFGNEGCYSSTERELAAKVLDKAGLVDHGTGIGWPWITEWGKEFLAALEKVETEGEL
jgi:hypothetical protein